MMEAKEVESPVDEEAEHLFWEGRRTLCRPLGAEDHVAEEVGMKPAPLSLPHGEGQDVGRAPLPSELAVQTGHLPLFHEEEAQLIIRTG